ncbi:hypothetical protein EV714DRAFT_217939, partial [Schizophyllum commune]
SRRMGLARLAGTLIKGGLGCSATKRATNVTCWCRTTSPSTILEADNDTKRPTI